ncbi:MAG: XdhC family protein [Rhodospirillales bacterium]|nr:XdhC family protein [Rhodospirillales bacterium]
MLTLYNVEPTGPRPAGSQMAVSDAGDFTGFLSGGCVEGALVEETKAAMDEGKNRSIRYGVNSPYFDIALPCGSAIDVYIDVGFSDELADELVNAMDARKPVSLITNMSTGESRLDDAENPDRLQLTCDGDTFDRLYRPPLKLVVAGKGPVLAATSEIAAASDITVHAITTEDETAKQCETVGATTSKSLPDGLLDRWTAVATLFHEHELEGPVLKAAMESDAFYIGALGSRNTHAERVSRFIEDGVNEDDVKRIKGPLGISMGSRNPPEIAISLVAEVLMTYREKFPV